MVIHTQMSITQRGFSINMQFNLLPNFLTYLATNLVIPSVTSDILISFL